MNWHPTTDITGAPVTVLLDEQGYELGRYYHHPQGFLPVGSTGKYRFRSTELEARAVVVERARRRVMEQLVDLSVLQRGLECSTRNAGPVPQEISGVQNQPTQSQVC